MHPEIVASLTRTQILDRLVEDGFRFRPENSASVAATIQQAARKGALLWTSERVISTLRDRPLELRRTR